MSLRPFTVHTGVPPTLAYLPRSKGAGAGAEVCLVDVGFLGCGCLTGADKSSEFTDCNCFECTSLFETTKMPCQYHKLLHTERYLSQN